MTVMDGQYTFWFPSFGSPASTLSSFVFVAATVEGIRGYQFPQETEDYTIDDPSAMDVDIDPHLVGRAHPEDQHSSQRSNLRLFPPPIFSRQGIPQNYKCVPPLRSATLSDTHLLWSCFGLFSFKPNPMSTPTTVVDEKTGEEKERLINKGRWKVYGPTSVSFAEKGVCESPYPSPVGVGRVRSLGL